MNTISFLDIFLIAGVSQGIFLSLSLQFLKNFNREANHILIGILLISTVMLSGRLMVFRVHAPWVSYLGIFADATIFLIGPLIYSYVRKLTFLEHPSYRLKWIDYILPIVYLMYACWYISLSDEFVAYLYSSQTIYYIFFFTELLGIVSFALYLVRTILLIRNFQMKEKNEVSNPQSVFKFLRIFLSILSLALLFWIISFLNAVFLKSNLPFLSYTVLWICIPIFIFAVGFYSLKQPDIFRLPIAKPDGFKARLNEEQIATIKIGLQSAMIKERLFMDPELTLTKLSDYLNTSSNNLSWYLNNIHEQSFSDFVNAKRIEEFVRRLNKGDHKKITLLGLAMEVGFNSKSTFNKVFKTQLGLPPTAYIKNMQVS